MTYCLLFIFLSIPLSSNQRKHLLHFITTFKCVNITVNKSEADIICWSDLLDSVLTLVIKREVPILSGGVISCVVVVLKGSTKSPARR